MVLTGISPIDFNNDPQQQEAFAQAILGSLPSEHQDAEVTDIVARSARRRRLQAGSVEVSYTIVIEQDDTEDVSDGGASILSDVTTSLSEAVLSGEFLQTLIEEAAAAGGSAAMAFMTIDVDVEASNIRIDAAVMTLTITTPSPTARPTHTHTPTSGACDSIHVHYGEACSSAHGEAHGCPIVNVPRETWDYDLWSCDDLCGRVGGWCERAAYMSDNHCGSDVHEEYELSCDQGIRDSGLEHPSHTLCWCELDGHGGGAFHQFGCGHAEKPGFGCWLKQNTV